MYLCGEKIIYQNGSRHIYRFLMTLCITIFFSGGMIIVNEKKYLKKWHLLQYKTRSSGEVVSWYLAITYAKRYWWRFDSALEHIQDIILKLIQLSGRALVLCSRHKRRPRLANGHGFKSHIQHKIIHLYDFILILLQQLQSDFFCHFRLIQKEMGRKMFRREITKFTGAFYGG